MKNLSEKIYLNLNMTPQEVVETKDKDFHEATKTWEITWSEERLSEHDPEYVRTDAFIERTADFLCDCIENCMGRYMETWSPEMKAKTINNFKNYMKS